MIGQRMLDLLNEQVRHELESYYLYLSMAAWFHEKDLDGMAHWLRCQAHEETTHAMKFFDHMLDRGGSVRLQDVRQLKSGWSSPREAWQDAFEHEKFITERINALMKAAREEGDYLSEPLLAWFASEQIEEETETEKIARQAAMVENDQSGLLMLDRELNARSFVAGSPFDRESYQAAA